MIKKAFTEAQGVASESQTLKNTIKRILQLQPMYSSRNTIHMAERGRLIRRTLPDICRTLIPSLRTSFADFADDMEAEGSDGIGRKTEAPWVRIFARAFSPNAREGFYIVIHFAANGSAAFITIGCGSTIWSAGDLKSISDHELKKRTNWARKVILNKWGSLDPFLDKMKLGAKASLPRTFEKATAFAKQLPIDQLEESDIKNTIAEAAVRLAEIYNTQRLGKDITPGDEAAAQIQSISKPLRRHGYRQGFGLTSAERKAVELCAMTKAEQWLKDNGYEVEDTHCTQSYDFLAKKNGVDLFVEVKGTISDICDSIIMTRNEVALHSRKKGSTALLLVSRIELVKSEDSPMASGGFLEPFICWDIDSWKRDPIAFQISRREP